MRNHRVRKEFSRNYGGSVEIMIKDFVRNYGGITEIIYTSRGIIEKLEELQRFKRTSLLPLPTGATSQNGYVIRAL